MIQTQTKPVGMGNGKRLKRLEEIARLTPGETIESVWAKYNHYINQRGIGEREHILEEMEQGREQIYKPGESTPMYAGLHS